MTTRTDLLNSALQLPRDERQALIHELAVSLEGEPAEASPSAEASWVEEITRRAEGVVQGTATTVDGREVVKRAIAELRGRDLSQK